MKLLMYTQLVSTRSETLKQTSWQACGSVWKQDSFSGKTGNTTIPKYNFQGQREGSITKSLRDVYQKGTEKAEQKFNHKMYERFVEILLPQD